MAGSHSASVLTRCSERLMGTQKKKKVCSIIRSLNFGCFPGMPVWKLGDRKLGDRDGLSDRAI